MKLALCTALIFLLASCASAPQKPQEISSPESTPNGDMPSVAATDDLETIVIVGTNDIHGALASQELTTKEPEGTLPIPYRAGGAQALAPYLSIVKKQFGTQLLWLDAGDEFQGTIESNSDKGAPMVAFFNHMALQGAAVGNHEFDFGPENDPNDRIGALKARMTEAKYPYLSANIIEKATGKSPPFPNFYPSKLFTIGGLKVGVIGLSTLDTPVTTLPTNIKSLGFTPLKEATIREAQSLRAQGADLIAVVAHAGLKCSPGRMPTHAMIRKQSDPHGPCGESNGGKNDEVVELLEALPPGTVDAVVAGHSHQIVHHWINEIPVIQGGVSARYFNLIYLTYSKKQKKVLHDRTRIEGPIPVCPLIFQNQGDCNGDRPAPKNGRGPLVNFRFHGDLVQPDPQVAALFQPYFNKAEALKKQVLGHAARRIEQNRARESELANLVADAVRWATKADVVFMNAGGIRAPLEPGPITYGGVFQVLPFDNTVVTLDVTGKELKLLFRVAQSGARGFWPISGVQMRVIDSKYDAPSDDLNGSGKIEPWEVNRTLEIRLADGSPIDDQKHYKLATLDFIVLGGDDFGWVMSQIPAKRINMESPLHLREQFIAYLKTSTSSWNTIEKPLVDPANPRLRLEAAPVKKAKGQTKGQTKGKKKRKSARRR